jgi:eukaryotic-like serine/threonine-protein kinase
MDHEGIEPTVSLIRPGGPSAPPEASRSNALDGLGEICDQFEQAWRSGVRPDLRAVLDAAAPEIRGPLFRELLPIDCECAARVGTAPEIGDYVARFPEYADWIAAEVGATRAPDWQTGNAAESRATVVPLTPGPKASEPHRPKERPDNGDGLPGPGDLVGDFEILERLGAGAFATVFRAWQRGVAREVALKFSKQPSGESRALSRLDGHPNIVRIFDERPLPDRGLWLIYMEFVDGPTLKEVIQDAKRDGAFAREGWPQRVCEWGARLADALGYAHRRNILHCDVKPANILLDPDDRPKLVDFNVSHRVDAVGQGIGGTLPYMSPEQLDAYVETDPAQRRRRIAELNGRSDLYSLGIVLWELATGERPFQSPQSGGDLVAALAGAIAARDAAPRDVLALRGANLPVGLRRVLLRCLERDPKRRRDRAELLARDLQLCLMPDLQRLLHPPAGTWRAIVERWPGVTLVATAAAFNALLAGISVYYNWDLLGREGESHHIQWFLKVMVPVVNGSGFTVGLTLLWWHARPALRLLIESASSAEAGGALVDRCALLGQHAARITLAAWTFASAVWLVTMSRLAWGWSARSFHFTGSVLLCGVIAAGLTFFLVTHLVAVVFLPALQREERGPLRANLEIPMRRYFMMMLIAPFIGLLLFAFAQNDLNDAKALMACLVVVAGLGIAANLYCAGRTREHLKVLSLLRGPGDSRV